jgi:hypothetical protein
MASICKIYNTNRCYCRQKPEGVGDLARSAQMKSGAPRREQNSPSEGHTQVGQLPAVRTASSARNRWPGTRMDLVWSEGGSPLALGTPDSCRRWLAETARLVIRKGRTNMQSSPAQLQEFNVPRCY